MSESALARPPDDVAGTVVAAIRERSRVAPVVAVVLGSGLGETVRIAGELGRGREDMELSYADLPGLPVPSVPGHDGKLWLGDLAGRRAVLFQGRIHSYEAGMPLASITSQVAAGLGARTVVLTAAVGAVDPSLPAGALVVVRDQINLMNADPLLGWRMPDGSPAFLDLVDVYDDTLSRKALAAARTHVSGAEGGVPEGLVTEGTYAAVSGPSFETPAEAEFLRHVGARVVGMSMVPEAVVARALGLRVVGLSFVTNRSGTSFSHEDVLMAAKGASEIIAHVIVALMDET